jgi:hypothetical protein
MYTNEWTYKKEPQLNPKANVFKQIMFKQLADSFDIRIRAPSLFKIFMILIFEDVSIYNMFNDYLFISSVIQHNHNRIFYAKTNATAYLLSRFPNVIYDILKYNAMCLKSAFKQFICKL